MRFESKVAIVTGGGSGMGRSAAVSLAREGCVVVIADVDARAGKSVADEIAAAGWRAVPVKADVGNNTEVKEVVRLALKEFGKIDILCNFAGILSGNLPFVEIDEAYIDRIIRVNLKGTILFCGAVVGHMMERKYGKIINIGSTAGVKGSENATVYGATKGGIIAFSRNLAQECARKNINVNCICPGLTETPATASYKARGEWYQKIVASVPNGRLGRPEDVVALALFLASDDASHIVGQTIQVDGGMARI